jgi:tetratricopeptide (TPR) repeat protein
MRLLIILLFTGHFYTNTFAQSYDTLTTKSGLKYYYLQRGNGPAVQPNCVVIRHYTVSLADGTKIESSRDKGKPFAWEHPSSEMIRGNNEALSLMKIGDRAVFIVPYNLAYGKKGLGLVPPKATLLFDIEVIDIKKRSLYMAITAALYEQPITPESKPRIKEAISTYTRLKSKGFSDLYVNDDQLDMIGQNLLPKFPAEAVEIFKLNTDLYPESYTAYESLGIGYFELGETELAIAAFEKAVSLNPGNTKAKVYLKQLKENKK